MYFYSAERFPSFRKTDFNWDAVDAAPAPPTLSAPIFAEAKSSDSTLAFTPEKYSPTPTKEKKNKKRHADAKENSSAAKKQDSAEKLMSPSRSPLTSVNVK